MMTGVTPQRTPRNPIQWTFRGVCYSLFLAHEVCFVLLQLKKMCKEGVYWGKTVLHDVPHSFRK